MVRNNVVKAAAKDRSLKSGDGHVSCAQDARH